MRKILIISFFSALLALNLSCSKDEQDFEGNWELITAPLTGYRYYWDFTQTEEDSGNVAIYTVDTLSGEVDTCSSGYFYVKNRVVTIGAPIAFCQWSTFDGEWDIHKLDKEFLTVIRYLPRGTIYLEFIKRN